MSKPAAKQGDRITAVDTHIVLVPAPPGAPVPTPLPNPFDGILNGNLSSNVNILGRPAAMVDSIAQNTPPHLHPAGPFQTPPSNKGTVFIGSATVFINGRAAARAGDAAKTCNDPTDLPVGTVVATGTVFIGG